MKKEEKHSNRCPICGRLPHKESKYCIFHASAGEKTEEEFKKALQDYIDKIRKENKDYNFRNFIFIGDINFKKDLNITVFKNANFLEATFEGDVFFREVTFQGEAVFQQATFQGEAFFQDTTFKGIAHFVAATFQGGVSFGEAIFQKYATFSGIIFQGTAEFFNATFKGDVSFFGATLQEGANFHGARFFGDADFNVENIKSLLIFSEAEFNQGKSLRISTLKTMNEVEIEFTKADLENVYLELILGKKTLINFNTKKILQNIQIKANQIKNHIFQEDRKEFEQAKEVYLLLKNNFQGIGRYEDASWALKKEKDMERKSYFHFKSLHKWLCSCFLNAIYGYGEKPERVFLSAILIILIYAFVYMNYGIISGSQLDNLPKYNILKELFKGIIYGDLLIIFKDMPWEQIINCLYFSTVTFTTLGLGDFCPVESWGRIFVGSEAFIGAFMIALFVYTFARRTGGR